MQTPKTYYLRGREYRPSYVLISNLEDRESYDRHLSHFEELLRDKEEISIVRMVASYDHEVRVNLESAIKHARAFFERLLTLHSQDIFECIVRVIRKEESNQYSRYIDALLFITPSLLEDTSRLYSQWSLEWRDVSGWIHNEVVVIPLATLRQQSEDESLQTDLEKGKRVQEQPLERVIREIEFICRSTKGGVFLETHVWPKG